MITISTSEGRSFVLRKSSNGRASAVQKEVVGFGTGARLELIFKICDVAYVRMEGLGPFTLNL